MSPAAVVGAVGAPVVGAPVVGAVGAPVIAPVSAPFSALGGPELCPVCGEARPGPLARYCDNCRYDFVAQRAFGAEAVPAPLPVAGAADPALAAVVGPVVGPRFDLHAAADVSLRRPEDPVPVDLRLRIFPLDLADHLIGRRSDADDIHPEITIADPGISRRHARILRGADGALSLLDLGSTNGTRLNGVVVEPHLANPLVDGDQITLGCWTRLVVKAR